MNVVLFEFENSLVDCAVIDQSDSAGFFNFEGLSGRYAFALPRRNSPLRMREAAANGRGAWSGVGRWFF
ncbi:hypothetical protein ACOAOD_11305 [Pseudomonas paraeruginosa]|uniref:hypothetical protein n=1 Tax=Pseudomonas paraeruginosa TaxID=2994495 RepID=UPI003B281783